MIMKLKILIKIFIFLLISIKTEAQNNQQMFYYAFENKINLHEVNNKILVKS